MYHNFHLIALFLSFLRSLLLELDQKVRLSQCVRIFTVYQTQGSCDGPAEGPNGAMLPSGAPAAGCASPERRRYRSKKLYTMFYTD